MNLEKLMTQRLSNQRYQVTSGMTRYPQKQASQVILTLVMLRIYEGCQYIMTIRKFDIFLLYYLNEHFKIKQKIQFKESNWKKTVDQAMNKESKIVIINLLYLMIRLQNTVRKAIETMLQEKLLSLFNESTEMYCDDDYPTCLALLNDCITLDPTCSILYSNRAIAHFHQKDLQRSLQDLQKAIRINHINYIAYFNLFSLHFLDNNLEQAFKNICFCMSSAHTVLYRLIGNEESLIQSIYYSYNNKQSLFLKAILELQKYQPHDSLQTLRFVYRLQTKSQDRRHIASLIRSIESLLNQSNSNLNIQDIPIQDNFLLKTDLECPKKQEFEHKVQEIIKEFNEVYKLINDYTNTKAHCKLSSSDKESKNEELSIVLEDKQTNYNTAQNSQTNFSIALVNPNERQSKTPELDINSVIEFTDQNKLYPLHKKIRVKFLIAALLRLQEQSCDKQLYVTLSYGPSSCNYIFRTALSTISGGVCKWGESSDPVNLTEQPSNLEIKVFAKRFTTFQDQLLYQSIIPITSKGYLMAPLLSVQGSSEDLISINIQTCL